MRVRKGKDKVSDLIVQILQQNKQLNKKERKTKLWTEGNISKDFRKVLSGIQQVFRNSIPEKIIPKMRFS